MAEYLLKTPRHEQSSPVDVDFTDSSASFALVFFLLLYIVGTGMHLDLFLVCSRIKSVDVDRNMVDANGTHAHAQSPHP